MNTNINRKEPIFKIQNLKIRFIYCLRKSKRQKKIELFKFFSFLSLCPESRKKKAEGWEVDCRINQEIWTFSSLYDLNQREVENLQWETYNLVKQWWQMTLQTLRQFGRNSPKDTHLPRNQPILLCNNEEKLKRSCWILCKNTKTSCWLLFLKHSKGLVKIK